MAEAKSKKVNKSKKSFSTDALVMSIVLLLIVGYIFFECYSATHVDVQTVTATTSTVYETIEAKALAVRREQTVSSNTSGVTVPCIADADKVKTGGNIAMVFANESDAQSYSRSIELQQSLDYYIALESKAAGVATDVESIDRDIVGDVNDYIRFASRGSVNSVKESALGLNDKLARRQMIIGESIDFSSVKADLQKQINECNASACQPTGYVKTEQSGIFSSYTDGLENAFDYDGISSIDVATLDRYFEQAQNAEKTDCLGKLITDYEWYFCCKVSANQIRDIKNGDILNVALKDSDEVIECQVVSGAEVDLGVSESVLVLKSSRMDASIASMRIEDIEIRYNEYTGFKLPSQAIHIDKDGNKVVYALIANKVSARKGEIIYSTKDFVVFEYDPLNSESIRLYDQIITQGKDLHDGKVYT